MNSVELIRYLRVLGVCDAGLEWVYQTPGEPEDIWFACPRGDWLLWLLDAVNYDAGTMRHIACDIAELALPLYEQAYPDDPRPRNCIAVSRRYADGEATHDELLAAWREAEEAARAVPESNAAAKGAAWHIADAAGKGAPWCSDPVRHADMIRARISWADVEREIERVVAD